MIPFPLLPTPIETSYRACTIPYRFPRDNPKIATPTEISWINVFANSIPSFRKRAESDTTVPDAPAKAKIFAERYAGILEDWKMDPESNGGPPDGVILGRVREHLLRELGFMDIFKKVKDEENAKAISLFTEVVSLSDAIEDEGERLENLVRGIFAGNIFDLGSAQLAEVFSKDGISFLATCQNLVPRPWVIDDLDNFQAKWIKKPWKKAVIFVDNSGADIILGILPFARELLRRGTQVVLAANELPAINDVTYTKLTDIVSQGRGIETNLYAQFKCDSFNIGMDMKSMLIMLPHIWQVEGRVAGVDLGSRKFQLDFDEEADIIEVLKIETLYFDSWMVSLVRWTPVVDPAYSLSLEFWICVTDVPIQFWADPTFRDIGSDLGTV